MKKTCGIFKQYKVFKTILLLIIFLLFFKLDVFATDACDKLILQDASFVGKVTMASNLRDYPCTYKSSVLGVSKIGEKYEIISKVDGWYKIKTDSGKTYWIWDKAISKTNEEIKEESTYVIGGKDRILINKFVNKMDLVIQKKGLEYKDFLLNKIENILNQKKYSDRLTAILKEIIRKIKNIEIEKEAENEVEVEEIEDEKIEVSENYNSTYYLENIDVEKVKSTWLSRYNEVREDLGVNPYSYSEKLESSALDWSKISNQRGEITHKRNTGDVYYDYDKITSWFKNRGVVCKNIYRATHTENIGWGNYSCNDGECSDELIGAIRSTFDFYMSEKGTSYDAHYRSIVHSLFTKIGLGIDIEDKGNGRYKYYLTVHYCTELIN